VTMGEMAPILEGCLDSTAQRYVPAKHLSSHLNPRHPRHLPSPCRYECKRHSVLGRCSAQRSSGRERPPS
jgi:hypothetical protein